MLTQYFHQLIDYIGNHPVAALVIILLISAGEAIFIIGLFIPSTVVLIGAGTLIGLGKLHFWPVFAAASLGAIIGDLISYWIGHIYKERIRSIWPFSHFTGLLDRGEDFFRRHGGKSVFIGRFIPGVKTVVPGVAGIAGMSPLWFTVINVVSALAWSAAHILPGIGVGRTIGVTTAANPRVLEFLIVVGVLLALVWYITRLLVLWLLPRLDRVRLSVADGLSSDGRWPVQTIRGILLNEGNIVFPFIYGGIAVAALISFASIVLQLFFDQEFVRSDQAISTYIQSLRTPLVDQFMIGVTMLGDGVVLAPVAIGLVGVIAWHRRWKLAGTVTLAFAGASVFVPVMKTLIHRTRPMELYQGAEGFSFPSGHATLSAAIVGITVLVCAHELRLRLRLTAFAIGAFLIVMIAFSRLYLRAHWPSDVFAGVLFGISLTFLFAWLLHGKKLAPISRRAAMAVGAILLVAYPLNLSSGYPLAHEKYVRAVEERVITKAEWLADPQQFGPTNRIMLDGELAQRIILQTNLPISDMETVLTKSDWKKSESGQVAQIINAILPGRSDSQTFVPFPETNNGALPVATFYRQTATARHQILRFWATGTKVSSGSTTTEILTGTVSEQLIDPIGFGYSLPELGSTAPEVASSIGQQISNTLSSAGNAKPLHFPGLYLLLSTSIQ